MIVLENPVEILKITRQWRKEGYSVSLVPTMGYFHDGHLSLMQAAKKTADRTVVSLFVNPTQFGPSEDLSRYPRDIKRDTQLAEAQGVDVLFCPQPHHMYLETYQTTVSVSQLSQGLCGSSRPGHFDGVATVVAKLFNIVQPDFAVFGMKDYQQLALIRQMVSDLNFPVEIIGHPIVRENDGLAMSSRNSYLNAEERKESLLLSQTISFARQHLERHQSKSAQPFLAELRSMIEGSPMCQVDYIEIVDAETLERKTTARKGDLLALAVFINKKVRLIDNGIL